MIKRIIPFLLITFLTACAGDSTGKKERTAKGPLHLGGVFRVNEVEDYISLFPLSVTEETGYQVASQIFEGLVRPDSKDLSIRPCLAESYEISENGTLYTFHIRHGVKFHNDSCFPNSNGRTVTAGDFKYCFDKLCEKSA